MSPSEQLARHLRAELVRLCPASPYMKFDALPRCLQKDQYTLAAALLANPPPCLIDAVRQLDTPLVMEEAKS